MENKYSERLRWSGQFYGTKQGQLFHKEEWEVTSFQPSPASSCSQRGEKRMEESGEMMWRHCVISRALKWWVFELQVQQPCFFSVFLKPSSAQLSSSVSMTAALLASTVEGHMESSSNIRTQGRGRHRRTRLWLSGSADTRGVRKCLRGPLVQDAIICLQRPLPWEPGYFHALSPPALRFLCLIVWWPIPWPPDPEKERGSAFKQRKRTDGLLWVLIVLLKSGHLIPAGHADICLTLLALTEMVFAISPSR